MKFLNFIHVLYCKTYFTPIKMQYKYLHNCMLKFDLYQTKYVNNQKLPQLYKVNSASIHLSNNYCDKSFQETENESFHEMLKTRDAYATSVVKQPFSVNVQDYSNCPKEISEFAKVTIHCMSRNINIEDADCKSLVTNLIKLLPDLSYDSLCQCLFLLCCLPPTPKTYTPNFKAIWNSLDNECVLRLPSWNTNQKLLVADFWFNLRLNRISQYNRTMISNLLLKPNHLSNSEIVQLMFYINLQRAVPFESLKALEDKLISVMKSVSIDELGIICLGFFKTKYKLKNIAIIHVIIERFTEEIQVAKQITLVAMLKFLKKSMQLSYTELYIPLFHKCTSSIPKWDVHTCVHLALLISESHVYHPLILNAIIERLCSVIHSARLKDCMKLLQCLSHFNHNPSEKFSELLFSEIFKEPRQSEISIHPSVLVYTALYYSYFGQYNYKLLNIVLDSNYVKTCVMKSPETDMTFAEVDCSVEIECKDYTGNRLGKNFWKILEKRRSTAIEPSKQNALSRLSAEIISSLQEIVGSEEKIHVKHLMPHMFSPDIVFQLSGSPTPLSFDEEWLFSPPKEQVWIAFVVGVPFSFAYRSKHMTGVTAMKLRQLEKLGYKSMLLPYFEIPRDSEGRKKYLEQKLNTIDDCHSFNVIKS